MNSSDIMHLPVAGNQNKALQRFPAFVALLLCYSSLWCRLLVILLRSWLRDMCNCAGELAARGQAGVH